MSARIVNFLLGAWLVLAPWLAPYDGRTAVTNAVVVGALVSLFAALGLVQGRFRLFNVGLGTWLATSPALLDMGSRTAALHHAIVGTVVFFLAVIPTRGRARVSEGWLTTPGPRSGRS